MEKSPDAFRTISEVADWLGVPTHVLRFWESRFAQVKPVKRAGGRRYYRPSDMELLGGIKRLLHDDGMTIRGVQKLLRDNGVRHVAGLSQPLYPDVDDAEIVEETAEALVVAFQPAETLQPDPAEAQPAETDMPQPEPDEEEELRAPQEDSTPPVADEETVTEAGPEPVDVDEPAEAIPDPDAVAEAETEAPTEKEPMAPAVDATPEERAIFPDGDEEEETPEGEQGDLLDLMRSSEAPPENDVDGDASSDEPVEEPLLEDHPLESQDARVMEASERAADAEPHAEPVQPPVGKGLVDTADVAADPEPAPQPSPPRINIPDIPEDDPSDEDVPDDMPASVTVLLRLADHSMLESHLDTLETAAAKLRNMRDRLNQQDGA